MKFLYYTSSAGDSILWDGSLTNLGANWCRHFSQLRIKAHLSLPTTTTIHTSSAASLPGSQQRSDGNTNRKPFLFFPNAKQKRSWNLQFSFDGWHGCFLLTFSDADSFPTRTSIHNQNLFLSRGNDNGKNTIPIAFYISLSVVHYWPSHDLSIIVKHDARRCQLSRQGSISSHPFFKRTSQYL